MPRCRRCEASSCQAGADGAAHAHLARTVVRRAERAVVQLAAEEAVTPALLRYLNRLSDHLFVLSRVLNDNGADDVLCGTGRTWRDDPAERADGYFGLSCFHGSLTSAIVSNSTLASLPSCISVRRM